MHFGNILMHLNSSHITDIRKTSSTCLPAECTTKLLYAVCWRCGPLTSRGERTQWLMNVPEVLAEYIGEVVAKTGQPMPTLDQPLLDSDGGVIDSMSMWPLIVFIESRFGIAIEDTDVMQEDFRTLRVLINFVESKLHS